MCLSSWPPNVVIAKWCGSLIGSRGCRRARSLAGCRRCRGSTPMSSPAGTPGGDKPVAAWSGDAATGRFGEVTHGAVGAGAAHVAEDPVAGRRRRLVGRSADVAAPGHGRGDAARRVASLRGARVAPRRHPHRRSAVFVVDGKGGHQRFTPMAQRFFTTLGHYLDEERPTDSDTDRVLVVLKGRRRGRPLSADGLR